MILFWYILPQCDLQGVPELERVIKLFENNFLSMCLDALVFCYIAIVCLLRISSLVDAQG